MTRKIISLYHENADEDRGKESITITIRLRSQIVTIDNLIRSRNVLLISLHVFE